LLETHIQAPIKAILMWHIRIPSYLHAKLNNKDHVAKLREGYMNDVIDVMDVMLAS